MNVTSTTATLQSHQKGPHFQTSASVHVNTRVIVFVFKQSPEWSICKCKCKTIKLDEYERNYLANSWERGEFCFALFLTKIWRQRREKSTKPWEILIQISHCNLKPLKGNELDGSVSFCIGCIPGLIICAQCQKSRKTYSVVIHLRIPVDWMYFGFTWILFMPNDKKLLLI